MDNIVVITQNVKLESLAKLNGLLGPNAETLVFSTQYIFENEKQIIENALKSKCTFKNFSDFMSDSDYKKCDEDAFMGGAGSLEDYYGRIKKIKNAIVVERIIEQYNCTNKFIVCDDLGLDIEEWINKGFSKVECDYYYCDKIQNNIKKVSRVNVLINRIKQLLFYVYSVYIIPKYYGISEGKKYIFFGSLNRIGYRMRLSFQPLSGVETLKESIIVFWGRVFGYVPKSSVIRMSTLHERGIVFFPDNKNLNLKLIQDGYLPPNYTSKYLLFYGQTIEYYTWDVEGGKTFEYHKLPHTIIPFREKLYLPIPSFPKEVKKVLCVASGAGDWTALKNRSDEDRMIEAFGRVAERFPEIEFVYRCHPVWIHPKHQGVNSINRAADYIKWLGLPNFRISGNIPDAREDGGFRLSFKRSSFEEDLKDVDIVFGEHSISMIDAAFNRILFCSVNVTGRRDFFCGITKMGFPHCESIDEIVFFLKSVCRKDFEASYIKAIDNYNKMTDKDE